MPIINKGAYIFAEPGGRCTVLSMDGSEIDLFGKFTSIKTTAVDTYNPIEDFLVETKVQSSTVEQFLFGIVVTVALAGIALAAAPATGGLSIVGLLCGGAAIGTGTYSLFTFAADAGSGRSRSWNDYGLGLLEAGEMGAFTVGAGAYIAPMVPPALALAGIGGDAAVAVAGAIPTIIVGAAEAVSITDTVIAAVALMQAAVSNAGGGKGEEGVQFDNNNGVPVKEKTTASNGLDYQSNPKHTPGQPGNRPDAGIEPRNSLELFEKSIPSVKKPNQRFTLDKNTNTLHRFYNDRNGTWHWSGSTNQGPNSLKGSQVPNDIKKSLKLPMKGW